MNSLLVEQWLGYFTNPNHREGVANRLRGIILNAWLAGTWRNSISSASQPYVERLEDLRRIREGYEALPRYEKEREGLIETVRAEEVFLRLLVSKMEACGNKPPVQTDEFIRSLLRDVRIELEGA